MKRELLLNRTKRYDKMTREELIEKCRELYEKIWHLNIKVKWDERKLLEAVKPELAEVRKELNKVNMKKHRSQTEIQKKKAELMRKYNRQIKDTLFEILGGKTCIQCGETDESCLQLDHINDDGYADRIRFGRHTDRMKQYYVKHPEEAKRNLQVMCASCNWKKKHQNGINTYKY